MQQSSNYNVKRAYTPYGYCHQQHVHGVFFSGLWPDPLTGTYSAGNGYRAYSPSLLRFLSSDQRSPFDVGGLNAYAYCGADPVNRVDTSGEAPIPIQRPSTKPLLEPMTSADALHRYGRQGLSLATSLGWVASNVVGEMEAITSGTAINQTLTQRRGRIAFTWSSVMAVASSVSAMGDAGGMIQLSSKVTSSNHYAVAGGVLAAVGYLDLQPRVSALWANSESVSAFGGLVARGAIRASGLDLPGRALAPVVALATGIINAGTRTGGSLLRVASSSIGVRQGDRSDA